MLQDPASSTSVHIDDGSCSPDRAEGHTLDKTLARSQESLGEISYARALLL